MDFTLIISPDLQIFIGFLKVIDDLAMNDSPVWKILENPHLLSKKRLNFFAVEEFLFEVLDSLIAV